MDVLKIAPTGSLLFIVIVQDVAVRGRGAQLDDQPPKADPAAGIAMRVTDVPATKLPVQPAPDGAQLIPAGLLVTVPLPRPTSKTLSRGKGTPPPGGTTSKDEVPAMSAPLLALPIAVIVVVPTSFESANPAELIVATRTSLDCQIT